jgi:catechol 2,3-dioxygenase-like lactoylglutathione lyase family enzyme
MRIISASTGATARVYEDGTVIIRNAYDFSLALHPVGQVEPSPAFLHAGFRAADPAEVRALMDRMNADGITIVEPDDDPDYVGFKCLDPDGHRIEVYWEP